MQPSLLQPVDFPRLLSFSHSLIELVSFIYLFIYFGPFSDFGFAFLADEAGVDQPSQTSLRPVGDYRQHLSL